MPLDLVNRHSAEFKAELVASCQHDGVSLAAIAMDHGINSNLLRRWVIEQERLGDHELTDPLPIHRDIATQFIPLTLPTPQRTAPSASASAQDIAVDLRQRFHCIDTLLASGKPILNSGRVRSPIEYRHAQGLMSP